MPVFMTLVDDVTGHSSTNDAIEQLPAVRQRGKSAIRFESIHQRTLSILEFVCIALCAWFIPYRGPEGTNKGDNLGKLYS